MDKNTRRRPDSACQRERLVQSSSYRHGSITLDLSHSPRCISSAKLISDLSRAKPCWSSTVGNREEDLRECPQNTIKPLGYQRRPMIIDKTPTKTDPWDFSSSLSYNEVYITISQLKVITLQRTPSAVVRIVPLNGPWN